MATDRNPVFLCILPMLAVEEAGWFQAGPVDPVQAAGVHRDFVGLRTRDVERGDAAMFAEWVLGVARLKRVHRQIVLAAEQLEHRRHHRQMQNPLLGADTATALGQQIEIDLCAEADPAAMAAAISGFQHVGSLRWSPKIGQVVKRESCP